MSKLKNFKFKSYINYIIIAVALVIFLLMDAFGLMKRSTNSILIMLCINLVLSISLALVVGFLGELSLGHAGFMCVGAFLGKFISLELAGISVFISFPLALIVGGISAAFFGLLIGLPTMRLKGDYLAIVTLAFGEIVRNVILNIPMFGGPQGLSGDTRVTTYVICFVAILVTIAVLQNLIISRHGRAIRAIKNNDIAARSVGVNVTKYKLMVFIISAFFAGVAGVLFSHNSNLISSADFSYNRSIEILVFVVLGGMGNITGTIIATTLLTVLPEMLRFLEDYRMLIYSVVLITIMLANASPKFKAFLDKVKDKIKDVFISLEFKAKSVKQKIKDEEEGK